MKNTRNLILIVEDDEKLRQTLEDFLTANHFAVLTAVDGEQALTLYYANNHLIDLILLDGMLPGMDGFEVLKTIRQYSDVPIIMLTARESEEDQLTGLTNGADNYITKPFRLRVLKAHMDVLLFRSEPGSRADPGGHSRRGLGLRLSGRYPHRGYTCEAASEKTSRFLPLYPVHLRRGLSL